MTRHFVHRPDTNQEQIVEDLRGAGYSVLVLSQLGDGCPDLLVGAYRRNVLLEVKGEGKGLSDRQIKWCNKWNGQTPVVVRTSDEAFSAVAET